MDKKKFKIVIAGGREFNDYNLMKHKLDILLKEKSKTYDIVIVSGKARGADSLGEKYAKEKGYEIEEYPANWNLYGKRAGYIRNKQMYEVCDAVVAFWDGKSRGTKSMIELCIDKPVRVVRY